MKKETKQQKNKGGRPTDYGQEILDKTKYYLENYLLVGDVIPSVAGLSHYIKIARSTIYDWAGQENKKEFSDMLDEILSDQERTLINKGLKGDFSPVIAKLMMGKHGYSDKLEATGKDGEPLFDNETRTKAQKAVREFVGGDLGKGK